MKCKACREYLSAYLDDQVPFSVKRDIEEHLDSCEDCGQALHELEAIKVACSQMEPVELPEGFHDQLMEALRRKAAALQAGPSEAFTWGRLNSGLSRVLRGLVPSGARLRTAMALVAVLIVGFIGYSFWVYQGPTALWQAANRAPGAPAEVRISASRGMSGAKPGEGELAGGFQQRAASEAATASVSPGQTPPGPALPQDAGIAERAGRALFSQDLALGPTGGGEAAGAGAVPISYERKIIKRASVELGVERAKFASAVGEITHIAEWSGGYIQESSVWTESRVGEPGTGSEKGVMAARFVLRVPQSQFQRVLDEIKKLGEVEREQISGQDVTEEYVDVESRIKALRVQEARLLELLSQAKSIDEILRVESELAGVRSNLESLVRRLRYLENMVALSSIEVSLRERLEGLGASAGMRLAQDAFRALLRTLRTMGHVASRAVVFAAGAAPVLAVAGAGWYVYAYKVRKRQ